MEDKEFKRSTIEEKEGLNKWKEKWKYARNRWKTNINIFQDIAAEDLLAYLIIKDKPKEERFTREFNWEELIRTLRKSTKLEFIDRSLQDLTKFLIMKNGFNEAPIEQNLYNIPLQIRKRKTQNMKILNECIERRDFKISQEEETRKYIEKEVRKIKAQNKKYRI
jgi:hypothetical protein